MAEKQSDRHIQASRVEAERRLEESKLRGQDLVRKNEEYIAQHREEEFQKQKAQSEHALKKALARPAAPPQDETYVQPRDFGAHDNLEIVPPSDTPNLHPHHGETNEQFKKRQDEWELYSGRKDRASPSELLHGIGYKSKSNHIHIINRCIVT